MLFPIEVSPIKAILYEIYIAVVGEEPDLHYYGQSAIKNGRTADQQNEKRFREHVRGKKSVIDKKITEVGEDACELTLLHEGSYGNQFWLDRDERALIGAYNPDELLNESCVIRASKSLQADKLKKEGIMPNSARLVVDTQLPTLTLIGSPGDLGVSLHYWANGQRIVKERIVRNRSRKKSTQWTRKKVEKLAKIFWKHVHSNYSDLSLINPFTEKDGALENLTVFIRDTLHYKLEITLDLARKSEPTPVDNDPAIHRSSRQHLRHNAEIRDMLALKRRRVEPLMLAVGPRIIQDATMESVAPQPMIIAPHNESVALRPIVSHSSVPAGFLAWQAAKNRKKHN